MAKGKMRYGPRFSGGSIEYTGGQRANQAEALLERLYEACDGESSLVVIATVGQMLSLLIVSESGDPNVAVEKVIEVLRNSVKRLQEPE